MPPHKRCILNYNQVITDFRIQANKVISDKRIKTADPTCSQTIRMHPINIIKPSPPKSVGEYKKP